MTGGVPPVQACNNPGQGSHGKGKRNDLEIDETPRQSSQEFLPSLRNLKTWICES